MFENATSQQIMINYSIHYVLISYEIEIMKEIERKKKTEKKLVDSNNTLFTFSKNDYA